MNVVSAMREVRLGDLRICFLVRNDVQVAVVEGVGMKRYHLVPISELPMLLLSVDVVYCERFFPPDFRSRTSADEGNRDVDPFLLLTSLQPLRVRASCTCVLLARFIMFWGWTS